MRKKITPEIIEEIKRDYHNTDTNDLAVRFGCSIDLIASTAYRFGLKKDKEFTHNLMSKKAKERKRIAPEIIEEIKRNYGIVTVSEMSLRYHVSMRTIRDMVKIFDIKKNKPEDKPEPEIVDKIRELKDKYTDKEMSEMLGLAFNEIKNLRRKYKIYTSDETRKEVRFKNGVLSDKGIAMLLVGTFNKCPDRKARSEIFLQHPHLIELKRNQLLLNRELKRMNHEQPG